MRRLIAVFLFLSSVFIFCGCRGTSVAATTSEEVTTVTFNMPVDDSINGYRTASSEPDGIGHYAYCGSKNSKKFHRADCVYAQKINSENLISYNDRQQFIDAGYSPCKKCNP